MSSSGGIGFTTQLQDEVDDPEWVLVKPPWARGVTYRSVKRPPGVFDIYDEKMQRAGRKLMAEGGGDSAGGNGGGGGGNGGGFRLARSLDDDADIDFGAEHDGRWEFLPDVDRFEYRLPVPPVYYKFLIGSNRKTLTRLQQESGAEIRIPSSSGAGMGSNSLAAAAAVSNTVRKDLQALEAQDVVTIRARDKRTILSAVGLIEYTMETCESKIPNTHFINIPIAVGKNASAGTNAAGNGVAVGSRGAVLGGSSSSSSSTSGGTASSKIPPASSPVERFQKFLDSKQALELNSHYFQKPEKLHFTLIMLKLHTEEQIQKVKQICVELSQDADFLQYCQGFRMRLRGLHYMNDDPRQVNVLYTEDIREETRNAVNRIAGVLFDALVRADVVTRDYLMQQRLLSSAGDPEIKIHCTLVNTKFYAQYMERKGEWSAEKALEDQEQGRYLNAKPLLDAFAGTTSTATGGGSSTELQTGFDFGEVDVREIHFSNLLETNRENRYYEQLAVLKLGEDNLL
ncbi:unnamed protein product [Amoebophrya sp. A25]|nr:unnamed protein product [Amoebophrya sp. A25]|eukprot:GSA25T00015510001.1